MAILSRSSFKCSEAGAGPWANFVHDDQMAAPEFDRFKRSKAFKKFVEFQVPAALFNLVDTFADMALVIEAHHFAIAEYMKLFPPVTGSKSERYLQTHLRLTEKREDPFFFMAVHGAFSEEAYCYQRPGLTVRLFESFSRGEVTLGELYAARPSFILRPLLPRSFASN